jgi:hypothetical protein
MDESSEAKFNLVRFKLRQYYNEIKEIDEQLEEEEITLEQSERALMLLDDKYAKDILLVI